MNNEIFTPEESCHHHNVARLSSHIIRLVGEKISPQSVYDFGCGNGFYLKEIAELVPIKGYGVEGTRTGKFINVGESSHKFGSIRWIQWDLRHPLFLPFDLGFVMSIEVAEHLHAEYHENFIDTLSRHSDGRLLLTFAVRGQGGTRHVSERNQDEVVPFLANWGFSLDADETAVMRRDVGEACGYMRNSIYFFRR